MGGAMARARQTRQAQLVRWCDPPPSNVVWGKKPHQSSHLNPFPGQAGCLICLEVVSCDGTHKAIMFFLRKFGNDGALWPLQNISWPEARVVSSLLSKYHCPGQMEMREEQKRGIEGNAPLVQSMQPMQSNAFPRRGRPITNFGGGNDGQSFSCVRLSFAFLHVPRPRPSQNEVRPAGF